jgi:hypothetical protein
MSPVEQAVKSDSETPSQPLRGTTSIGHTEIRVKGKAVSVPSAQIDGRTITTSGKWLKMAVVQDEELVEGETVADPESFISRLKTSGLNADLFTFAQKLTDAAPKHRYRMEWENLAIVPITNYSDWWEKRLESSVRRAVRKAAKSGVEVRLEELDDRFVKGIVGINNETPIRQGKAFWHFQKSFDEVKLENSTYPGRNIFLGAYYQGEMIGFIRMICVDKVASITQLLSMMKHYDKRPANAMIAKAVETCEQKGISHLMYCNYIYNDPNSSLTEFKRRNGFEQVLVPRYYIPLTLKGKVALKVGLHHGLKGLIPKPLFIQLLKIRSSWYERRMKTMKETA